MNALASIGEIFSYMVKALKTKKYFKKGKDYGLDERFVEYIMLSVTSVNKCEMCSYYHTKVSLEMGLDNEEVVNLLDGDLANIDKYYAKALMFSMHYADSRSKYSQEAFNEVKKEYGLNLSLAILATIRMIMLGNSVGIIAGSFKNRFKGKKDKRSNLFYELSFFILFIPMVLLSVIVSIFYREQY